MTEDYSTKTILYDNQHVAHINYACVYNLQGNKYDDNNSSTHVVTMSDTNINTAGSGSQTWVLIISIWYQLCYVVLRIEGRLVVLSILTCYLQAACYLQAGLFGYYLHLNIQFSQYNTLHRNILLLCTINTQLYIYYFAQTVYYTIQL